MPADFPPHAFWDFSLEVYGRPGVAPACLELQERHGLDVNVLMYCLWLGDTSTGEADARFEEALSAVREWHAEVVRTLRAVRKRLKTPIGLVVPELTGSLRARVQKIEIDAEHLEQLTLAAHGPSLNERSGLPEERRAAIALTWLRRYIGHLGLAFEERDRQALAAIVAGCFALPADAIRPLMNREMEAPS